MGTDRELTSDGLRFGVEFLLENGYVAPSSGLGFPGVRTSPLIEWEHRDEVHADAVLIGAKVPFGQLFGLGCRNLVVPGSLDLDSDGQGSEFGVWRDASGIAVWARVGKKVDAFSAGAPGISGTHLDFSVHHDSAEAETQCQLVTEIGRQRLFGLWSPFFFRRWVLTVDVLGVSFTVPE